MRNQMDNPHRHTYNPTSYRMTQDEFERFVTENDPLAEMPNAVRNVIRLVHANPYLLINLGYGGVTWDAGFYWVRTVRTVDWM